MYDNVFKETKQEFRLSTLHRVLHGSKERNKNKSLSDGVALSPEKRVIRMVIIYFSNILVILGFR